MPTWQPPPQEQRARLAARRWAKADRVLTRHLSPPGARQVTNKETNPTASCLLKQKAKPPPKKGKTTGREEKKKEAISTSGRREVFPV